LSPKKKRGQAPSSDPHALELVLAKLATSGLDEADFKLLRYEALGPQATAKLHPSFKPLTSLKITYWRPDDLSQALAANPAWPPFYRLRYIRLDGDKKDDLRYTNEPLAGTVAYFPPSVDWPAVLADADQTLIITEGELKAAKACREGCPAIGLGGVWNFKSSNLGITFLPELELVNWVKRRVYVVFDSDMLSKPGVQAAMNALSEELAQRGALPFVVYIPEGDEGKKQGLDDWCVANPGLSLLELIERRQPLTQVRKLFELNNELVYIRDKGVVIDQRTGNKMMSTHFKEVYQTVDYAELVVTDSGAVSLKKAPVATSWLRWPLRNEVNSMTYKPGRPQIIGWNCKHPSEYNLWPGWGCQPKEGDASPFLALVDHLFAGADPADKTWFLRWCAYPLQFPGTKLFTAAVIHGVKHGTGKSLIGYTLGRIYGKNFTEINQNSLHGGFNGWAEAKQLVMGDDVTGSNKRADNDLLKKMITQSELRVNTKFMPEYVVPDCVNYLFTSNHPDAFFLENDDRRFFIHEVQVGPLDEMFYMDYMLWLDTTGPSGLFDYLLKLDIGEFNPSGPARRTIAKDQMTADTRSDLGEWVHKLRADPDSVLRVGEVPVPGDLFTSGELLGIYDPTDSHRVTANGLGRELRRAAVPRANQGLPLRGAKGVDRYYIVRHPERWLRASPAELSAQLALQVGGQARPKKF
jgi:hypothetical protein